MNSKFRIVEKANGYLFFKDEKIIGEVKTTYKLLSNRYTLYINNEPCISIELKGFASEGECQTHTWIPDKLRYRVNLKENFLFINEDVYELQTKGWMKRRYEILKNGELYARINQNNLVLGAPKRKIELINDDANTIYILFYFVANQAT